MFASDPVPELSGDADSVVLHKELDGYPNYGTADDAADVLYDGETDRWVFDVPNLSITSVVLAFSMSADAHYQVPISSYAAQIWIGDTCTAELPLPVTHGMPYDDTFYTWTELALPAQATAGTELTVTMTNLSSTADPLDWIAVDWIELRLGTQ